MVQLEVRRGGNSLVHGPDDIWAEEQSTLLLNDAFIGQILSNRNKTDWSRVVTNSRTRHSNLPFVILAVEESVEYVTEGSDMVKVVQDDHSGKLCVRFLRVALLCQVGQILTQILRRKYEHKRL